MSSYCVVKHCKSKVSTRQNISFFRFPSDKVLLEIWIENCDSYHLPLREMNSARKNYRVCGLHFEDKMFLNTTLKNRLTFNAVPTLFNDKTLSERKKRLQIKKEQEFKTQILSDSCSNPISEQKPDTMPLCDNVTTYYIKTETPESSSDFSLHLTNLSSENMKLLSIIESKNQEIENLKVELKSVTQQLTQVNTVEQMLKLCKLFLPPSLFLFINTHINNRNKRVKEFKYCNQIMELAKTIYLLSPLNVYQFLQSLLPLPPPFILRQKSNLDDIITTHSSLEK